MSPLWLLPLGVLLLAVPFLVWGLRAVAQETEALIRESRGFRGQLQPALVRLQSDGDRLARHQLLRRR